MEIIFKDGDLLKAKIGKMNTNGRISKQTNFLKNPNLFFIQTIHGTFLLDKEFISKII